MPSTRQPIAAALAMAAGLVCSAAHAQRPVLPICSDNPAYKLPPCTAPAGSEPPPAAPAPSANPAASQFPFPGDAQPASPPASTTFPFPGSAPTQPAANPQPAATTPPAAPGAFPFPGESVPLPVTDPNARVYDPKTDSDAPIHPAASPPITPPPHAPAPADSTSSSSSSAADPDAPSLKDIGSEGSTPASRRRLPKVEDRNAREEEDVKVAKYYHSTGNYMAAYMRAKDALKIDPRDPEAQFALATNAQKLSKRDEAIAGYTAYLRLEPDGDSAKAAHKALDELK